MLSLKQANAGGQDFKMLWSQLQHGQKQPKPLMSLSLTGPDQPRPSIRPPPDPRVNGHLISLPPSWLQKDAGAASASDKSERNSAQNPSENSNPVTPQKPTRVSIYSILCVVQAVE